MANRLTAVWSRKRKKRSETIRSGATYSSFRLPSRMSSARSRTVCGGVPLCTAAACTPTARSAATWSSISAISGDTTTAVPSRNSAGIW